MSILQKLFKKKSDKVDTESTQIPIEGFEQCIKLLLAYVGEDVTDFRISAPQPDQSSEGDGTCLSTPNRQGQGMAVLRYLGKCHGLSGADAFEDLEIEQIVDVFTDFRIKLLNIELMEDAAAKEMEFKRFGETQALVYLHKFDAIIATNGGHLALNKLTWADFLVAGMWSHIRGILMLECDDQYPRIKSMVENVVSISRTKRSES